MTVPITQEREGLRPGLRRRHMTMIAIGGAIGAGLFVGSGSVIRTAGPAAVLSYAAAGLLVLCVLRALGEMVVARPVAGSLAEYARMSMGPFAGFVVGWLYWYLYVILVGAEAVAGAAILGAWVELPQWVLSAALLVIMTAVNLVSVKSFGEFEFWFASIKVVAIVLFLVLGAVYLFGLWPDADGGLHNLTGHGGFAPNGVTGVFSAIVVVMFAFGGTEIVTVAAAESRSLARPSPAPPTMCCGGSACSMWPRSSSSSASCPGTTPRCCRARSSAPWTTWAFPPRAPSCRWSS